MATWDDRTRSGTLLDDAGHRLAYDAASLADHVRILRLGQRVHLELSPDGTVTGLRLWP